MERAAIGLALLFSVTATPSNAETIAFTKLYDTTGYFDGGTMHDPTTGAYFRRDGYNPVEAQHGELQGVPIDDGLATFTKFANAADFESNTNGTVLHLQGLPVGTNFSVKNGYIYGHNGDLQAPQTSGAYYYGNTDTVAKWDSVTGAVVAQATYPNFNGYNGLDSFEWGGFSAMNVFQDSTGMYLYSGASTKDSTLSGPYSLAKIDDDLSLTNIITGLAGAAAYPYTPGYAFMADGKLFAGGPYNGTTIDYSVDAATGFVTPLSNIQMSGISFPWISNMNYIAQTDTLYVRSSNALYKATGITSALGLASAVPEPATWAMMLVGLGAVGFTMRVRRKPWMAAERLAVEATDNPWFSR